MSHSLVKDWKVVVKDHAKRRLIERWPQLDIQSKAEAEKMLRYFVETGVVLMSQQIGEMLDTSRRMRKQTKVAVYNPILGGVIPVSMESGGYAHLLTVFPAEAKPKYKAMMESLKEELTA